MELTGANNEIPTLEKIISCLLRHESLFATPRLTNVVSYENKVVVKVDKALLLQGLAEQAQNLDLQCLVTNQTLVATFKRQESCKSHLYFTAKFFLDGVSGQYSKSKYVSVAVSIADVCGQSDEQKVCVSVFLKRPDQIEQSNALHKSFKTTTCQQTEKFSGFQNYISKKEFSLFIDNNGAVIFGFLITLMS